MSGTPIVSRFLLRSRLVFVTAALAVVLAACGGGQVVATIADGDLYSFDISEQMVEDLSVSSGVVDKAVFAQDLTNTIVELIVIARAETDYDITFNEEEIEDRRAELQLSVEQQGAYEEFLTQQGFTDERVRRIAHQQLVAEAVEELLLADADPITDDEIDAFVKDTIQGETNVCASHILLETEEDALAALERVQAGEDFAAVAGELSTGPSGPEGGDLGCSTLGQYVKEFADGAFAAEIGVPTDPVRSSFGYHIILVTERTEPDVDVDTVRENATTVLNASRGGPLVEEWLLGVVAEADVTVEPEFGTWVGSPVPTVTPPA
jgi:parvulin-like peptidyl-prolyl isomerase